MTKSISTRSRSPPNLGDDTTAGDFSLPPLIPSSDAKDMNKLLACAEGFTQHGYYSEVRDGRDFPFPPRPRRKGEWCKVEVEIPMSPKSLDASLATTEHPGPSSSITESFQVQPKSDLEEPPAKRHCARGSGDPDDVDQCFVIDEFFFVTPKKHKIKELSSPPPIVSRENRETQVALDNTPGLILLILLQSCLSIL